MARLILLLQILLLVLASACTRGGPTNPPPAWLASRLLGSLPADLYWAIARTGKCDTADLLPAFPGQSSWPHAVGFGPSGMIGICPEAALSAYNNHFGGKRLALVPISGDLVVWSDYGIAPARATARAMAGDLAVKTIKANNVWPELVKEAASSTGNGLLWLDLHQLRQKVVKGWANKGGKGNQFIFGSLYEVLNLDSFEALLLRFDKHGRFHGGLRLWPDTVGLGHLMTGGDGGPGLTPLSARDGELGVCWVIHPPGLWGMVEGLRTAKGIAGPAFTKGLDAFSRITGLDPARDVVAALAGPVVICYREQAFSLRVSLKPGKEANKLRQQATSLALVSQLAGLAGRKARVGIKNDWLQVSFGSYVDKPLGHKIETGTKLRGRIYLPLQLVKFGSGSLSLGLRQSEYGLAITGQMQSP